MCLLSVSAHNVLERHPCFLQVSVVYTFLLCHFFFHSPFEDIGGFADLGYEYLHIFSLISDKYLGVRLLGHMVSIYFTLLETAKCFPKWLDHFGSPPECVREFWPLHILTNTYFNFKKWNHFDRCVAIGFSCALLWFSLYSAWGLSSFLSLYNIIVYVSL